MGNRRNEMLVGAGLIAALLSGGVALAQPPRLIPPPDMQGVAPATVDPLGMPADSSSRWLLAPDDTAYELRLEGTLQASAPDSIRVDRGADEPDAVLRVGADALFFLEGRAVSPAQIPIGAPLVVAFDLQGNERIARRIEAVLPGDEEAAAALGEGTQPPFATELPGPPSEEAAPPFLPAAPGDGG